MTLSGLFVFGMLIALQLMPRFRAQSCSGLGDEESMRRAHVDGIKRAILFKLHLEEEPENPTDPITVPQPLLDEYHAVSAAQELVARQQIGCTEQPEYPPHFIVLQPQEVLRRSGYHGVFGDFPLNSTTAQQSSTHLLSFDLDLRETDVLTSAELRLWYRVLNEDSLKQMDKQRISIYHVFKQDSDRYYGEDPTHYCTREQVSLEMDGYVSFNITTALTQWADLVEQAVGNFYLEVDVEDVQTVDDNGDVVFKSPVVEIDYTDLEGRYSKTTQLVIRAFSSSDLRRRRLVQNPEGNGDLSCSSANTRNCCKRNLVVNIHRDLNWLWILRPRTLSANYCSGFCSVNWPVATYHTLVNLLHSTRSSNPTGSPAPCCVPNKFVPLPFLIFNRTTIELVTIDDLSIESCICR